MEEFVYMGNGQRVPEDVVYVRINPSVTEVDDQAFRDCTQLREVVMYEGLKIIGNKAFAGCISLDDITIPSTVTEIEYHAFDRCTNLRKIELHEGLEKIGGGAFQECTSLQSITIPSTVTKIDAKAFWFCNTLREVRLHEGLQTIGIGAFRDCSSLERCTFPVLSTRLNNVVMAETEVNRILQLLNEIDAIRGLIQRNINDLFIPARTVKYIGWNTIKASLDRIVNWINLVELNQVS